MPSQSLRSPSWWLAPGVKKLPGIQICEREPFGATRSARSLWSHGFWAGQVAPVGGRKARCSEKTSSFWEAASFRLPLPGALASWGFDDLVEDKWETKAPPIQAKPSCMAMWLDLWTLTCPLQLCGFSVGPQKMTFCPRSTTPGRMFG